MHSLQKILTRFTNQSFKLQTAVRPILVNEIGVFFWYIKNQHQLHSLRTLQNCREISILL
jgi:hypothetical protein